MSQVGKNAKEKPKSPFMVVLKEAEKPENRQMVDQSLF